MIFIRLLRLLGFASAVALAHQGLAQSAAPVAAGEEPEVIQLERFVVTGSLIPVPAHQTFSPTTVFSFDDFSITGAATPIEALRTIPGFIGAVATEQRTNGGTGASGVNLRGLDGTLTLLNGHRTPPFENFNALPTIAISTIEVVKDGASALYGADALAGVFNTQLHASYEGTKFDVYYGNTTDKDAGVLRFGFITGGKRGATDAVFAFESYSRNALYSGDRAPSKDADGRPYGGVNKGSPAFSGRTTARLDPTGPVLDLVLKPGLDAGYTAADFIPFDTNLATSNQMLNFRIYNPSIPAQERESYYGRVNQKIFGRRLEAYAHVLYTHDVFDNALAPSPMSIVSSPQATNAANRLRAAVRQSPHIPAGLIITSTIPDTSTTTVPVSAGNNIIGSTPFRTIAMGPRRQVYERDAWDVTGGFKGTIGQTWSWNAEAFYSKLYRELTQSGAPGRTPLLERIVSGAYNPFALDSASGVNPLNGVAFDNPKALAESAASGKTDRSEMGRGIIATANGTLIKLPTGDLKLGFGGDYYKLQLRDTPSAIIQAGDFLGLNTSNPSLSYKDGRAFFSELVVPFASPTNQIPLVQSLDLSLSGRYDDQTLEGVIGTPGKKRFVTRTPKIGLRWMVNDDLLVRSTWARGFRAPTLTQLFRGSTTSNLALRDPLGFPIANQTRVTFQGTPGLDPEESKTYSIGTVWSPGFIPGFSLTADYYSASITGLVGEGSQYILNQNALGQGPGFVPGNPATINPAAPFASRITRSVTGSVSGVQSDYFNISERSATGIDLSATYVWPWKNFGTFTTRADLNATLKWDLLPQAGSPAQDFVGVYIDISNNAISPGSIPEYKGELTQQWERGPWGASLSVNYISELQDDPNFTIDGLPRTIEAWVTVDTQISYQFKPAGTGWKKCLANTTVRLGASNLLDEAAPFAAGAFNDSYDVTTHSNRGRFVYTQITKKF